MQRITPFLWFEKNNAEEATNYYVSVFNGAPNKAIAVLEKAYSAPQ